jgi:TPR repeat protein
MPKTRESIIVKAAEGYAKYQFKLGHMYDNGNGVEKNYKEAVKWYRLAAEQGNSNAQTNLGVMYEFGNGVEKNYKEAVKWYRLAAEQENSKARDLFRRLKQKKIKESK